MLTIKMFWKTNEKGPPDSISFSYLRYKTSHTLKRIVVWAILTVMLSILIIMGLTSSMFSFASFLPAFLLLGIYVALSIYDGRHFWKSHKAFKALNLCFQDSDQLIGTFLQEGVKVRPIQRHDISAVDKYGNRLIISLLKKEWLVEIQYIDVGCPSYHSFRFDEFSKKTLWISKGKNNEPRWHEVIERLNPINLGDDEN